MSIVSKEVMNLKENLTEMLYLVLSQVNKSKTAFCNLDTTIAEDIMVQEHKVNSMELVVDKLCTSLIVLYTPVASDMRFTISILKMNSDVERIGDYADSIAKYVLEIKEKKITDSIGFKELGEQFDVVIDMMEDVIESIVSEDMVNIKSVFSKDRTLNKFNEDASKMVEEYVQKNPNKLQEALFVFSTIKKIERMGDHVKNIAEDWVYYLEGKVLKHKKF